MALPGTLGSQVPPGADAQSRRIADLERALRELGPSVAKSFNTTVAQLNELVNNLTAQVDAAIAANSYTAATIDAKIANPPAAVTIGGLLTANAGVTSTDVYNRILPSSYSVQYVDSTGRMGTSPSSRRFKQDITPATIDPAAVYAAQIVTFRYISVVEEMGDQAPVQIGGIAEQFDECGLSAFVTRNGDGEPQGIAYEKLSVALMGVVQDQNRRLSALEAKLP